MDDDTKFFWMLSYLVALHAAGTRPPDKLLTPPSEIAAITANNAVKQFHKFRNNQQVEGT